MNELMRKIERKHAIERDVVIRPGDTAAITLRIREGDKERLQTFQGTIISIRGAGTSKSFIVRKASGGVYVERIFPYYSPLISELKIIKHGRVRRAKLYYQRKLSGKSTRLKELVDKEVAPAN